MTKGDARNKGAKGTEDDDTTLAPIPPPLQAATPSSNEQIAERKRMDRASEIAVGSPYSLPDGTSLFQLDQRPRLWNALSEMGIDLKGGELNRYVDDYLEGSRGRRRVGQFRHVPRMRKRVVVCTLATTSIRRMAVSFLTKDGITKDPRRKMVM